MSGKLFRLPDTLVNKTVYLVNAAWYIGKGSSVGFEMDEKIEVPAKKLEIIEWAYDRFYDGGFHATGIDAVMADSGISKRSLYKYFSSKEELIEAVLDHYGEDIAKALFAPALSASTDPREQISAFFDIRKEMMKEKPVRGCLGIKAAQEYIGRHDGIEMRGRSFALYVERSLVAICERGCFADAKNLGRQLAVIFQGAVLLSQVYGETSPFLAAKTAALILIGEREGKAQ